MSSKRYQEEFKIEVVKQITERGSSDGGGGRQDRCSQHSLYAWLKRYSLPGIEDGERQGYRCKQLDQACVSSIKRGNNRMPKLFGQHF
jgi:transposase